jgi:phosphoribosyl 1,2-cyclic phosphate phosphodiesterase
MLASKCDKVDGIILLTNIQIILLVLTTYDRLTFRQGEIPVYAHHRVIENLNRFEYVLKPLIGILERHQ